MPPFLTLSYQGDIESIASQSPKDLTRLIEQISGSQEYRDEYERLKALFEKATEEATFAFNKKRAINAELKQLREQKTETVRFQELNSEQVNCFYLDFNKIINYCDRIP